jgi:hypothetical protein
LPLFTSHHNSAKDLGILRAAAQQSPESAEARHALGMALGEQGNCFDFRILSTSLTVCQQ